MMVTKSTLLLDKKKILKKIPICQQSAWSADPKLQQFIGYAKTQNCLKWLTLASP
jgi:hypothetical protein